MAYEYDYLFYIGKFYPFHLGHGQQVKEALEKSKVVVVFAGSANTPLSVKNPFSFEIRKRMIMESFPDDQDRLFVFPLDDMTYYDNAWVAQVQKKATEFVLEHGNDYGFQNHGTQDFKIGIVGFEKDGTSYYLKMFPQWESVLMTKQWGTLNATDIRRAYFQRAPVIPHDLCSPQVVEILKEYMLTDDFRFVVDEQEEIDSIKSKWFNSPFEPHFCTTDAVLVQSAHVLLYERDEGIGLELLALPGRHVRPAEGGAYDNIINEVYSFGISDHKGRIPKAVLESFYRGFHKQFDKPARDPRGFYSTTVFRFNVPDGDLFKVKKNAKWVPIGELSPENMFLDHYFIVKQMLDN